MKILYIILHIQLFCFSFIKCILEIPLKPLKIQGIPKYKNITVSEPYENYKSSNNYSFYEHGNSYINGNLLFLATIKLGSNKKEFNLLLDTGSPVFWVAKNGVTGKNYITNFFNPSSSTTCNKTTIELNMKYGTGYCLGLFYRDYVEYIENKNFYLRFGVASSVEFQVNGADGIIGLTKSYDEKDTSFIHMLKEYKVTDSTAFSLKFENEIFSSGVTGKMYIGKHEDFSKSNTVSCPFTSNLNKIFWTCKLSSLELKGDYYSTKSSRSYSLIFDTGTNRIILPTTYLDDIREDLSDFGCFIKDNQLYCNYNGDVPNIRFNFNGNTLIIPREYAFYQYNSNTLVSLVIFENTYPIIGSVFFFLFHTLFDEENEELKFYPLKGELVKGGLSGFVIFLIIIGSILLVAGIIYIIYFCIKRRKKTINISDNMLIGDLRQNYYETLFKT